MFIKFMEPTNKSEAFAVLQLAEQNKNTEETKEVKTAKTFFSEEELEDLCLNVQIEIGNCFHKRKKPVK